MIFWSETSWGQKWTYGGFIELESDNKEDEDDDQDHGEDDGRSEDVLGIEVVEEGGEGDGGEGEDEFHCFGHNWGSFAHVFGSTLGSFDFLVFIADVVVP